MKTSWVWALMLVGVLIVIGLATLVLLPAPKPAVAPVATSTPATASLPDLLTLATPLPGSIVSSPLTVQGEARGNFYFEAVFPVQLKDAAGNIIAQGQAQAQSDWMTAEFVPFVATLTFPAQPAGSIGTLVLKNDNPSGDPANQKELDIPVKF